MEKIFEDKEFHGSVSFFGQTVVKSVGSTVFDGGFTFTGDMVMTSGDLTMLNGGIAMTLGDFILTRGDITLSEGNITLPSLGKLYFDGGDDTYIYQSAANIMQWVSGGNSQMYNSGYGMHFPRGAHIIAVDKTANSFSTSTNGISIAETRVNVIAVENDADDIIYLPRIDQVENGHIILIMCDAGSNFEIRTEPLRSDKINTVDCSTAGGKEYLAIDNQVITCVMRNETDGWVLTAVTALGAVATPIVPD
jgi:hypothetical protein